MLGSFIAPSSVRPLRNPLVNRQPPTLVTKPVGRTPAATKMAPTAPASEYHMTCLCGAVEEPGTLLISPTIPAPGREICWCTDCNWVAGCLGAAFPVLKQAPSEASLSKCVKYDSSKTHRRYHCGTCGCSTFVERMGEWFAIAGIIERRKDAGPTDVRDVVRVEFHKWIKNTVDGGMIPKMLKLGKGDNEREIELRETSSESRIMKPEEIKEMERTSIDRGKDRPSLDEKLIVKCHCGGIDLRIRRADYGNDTQGTAETYIPPDKDKYLACFCVCRSCRLQMGVSTVPWCYVPPANITIAATGEQVKVGSDAMRPEANKGTTLKVYKSSEDIYRSFCDKCGASVFYRAEEEGHNVVDVAVGLLRTGEGIMARRWLDWAWGRISHREEATDAELYEALVA
jgi:hypothetical protein